MAGCFRTTHAIPAGGCTVTPFYRWENAGTGRLRDLASGGSKPQREMPLSKMPLPPPCKGRLSQGDTWHSTCGVQSPGHLPMQAEQPSPQAAQGGACPTTREGLCAAPHLPCPNLALSHCQTCAAAALPVYHANPSLRQLSRTFLVLLRLGPSPILLRNPSPRLFKYIITGKTGLLSSFGITPPTPAPPPRCEADPKVRTGVEVTDVGGARDSGGR